MPNAADGFYHRGLRLPRTIACGARPPYSGISANMEKVETTSVNIMHPSRADRPDLDWSQIRETVMMLDLAVAQIRNSMAEGDDSVTALGGSFTFMMEQIQAVDRLATRLPEGSERTQMQQVCHSVAAKIDDIVTSFQFYDKLVQRLSHVCNSLGQLADLVADGSRIYNPRAWAALQQLIKSKYTVDADRRMFDAILSGSSVEQALALANELKQETHHRPEAEIELF